MWVFITLGDEKNNEEKFLSEIEFYIAQASLKLADSLEFTSRVLGVHACAIAPSFSPV